mgnify:CR=1 FL=1
MGVPPSPFPGLEATIMGTMATLVAGFTPKNYQEKYSEPATSHGQLFRCKITPGLTLHGLVPRLDFLSSCTLGTFRPHQHGITGKRFGNLSLFASHAMLMIPKKAETAASNQAHYLLC